MTDDQKFEQAVRSYWSVRKAQAEKKLVAGRTDAGTRGEVTGGAHLDAMAHLIEEVFVGAGFKRESIRRSASVELPGFYRPTKKWDLLVIEDDVLVAAIEFKSQVGPSFGNNFNNRVEESLGNAVDIWRAYEAGSFGSVRPWIGYVFFLEEHPKSTTPVRVSKSLFPTDPIFDNTSYKDRYQILCQRLLRERLYDAACFVTSSADPETPIHQPSDELSFASFRAAILGRASYVKALAEKG